MKINSLENFKKRKSFFVYNTSKNFTGYFLKIMFLSNTCGWEQEFLKKFL